MSRLDSITHEGFFNVFIIGPMGSAAPTRRSPLDVFQSKQARRQADFGAHLDRMEQAIKAALLSLGLPSERFQISNPNRLRGAGIVNDVFAEIDRADFAVADISSRSPNVFYELAFFNALGTPVVLLDYEGESIPFYWTQNRIEMLKDFSIIEIEPRMKEVFKVYFDPSERVKMSINPISDYYQAPLIDISASSGVAAGFFENFASPVLYERQGALGLDENGVDRLVVIRPERINDHDKDQSRVKPALAGHEWKTLKAPLHRRGQVTACVKDGAIVDFPTALYTMVQAPRYRKLRKQLHESDNLSDAMKEDAFIRMEEKFIAAYFRTLKFLIDDTPSLARRKIAVVRIEDFVERGLDAPSIQ